MTDRTLTDVARDMDKQMAQLEADNRAIMEVVRAAVVAMSNAGVGSAGQWTISNRSHARLSKALSALPAHLKEEASK